jgi:FKBP-type peptidyl-prolyl cis-trans isomerase FklB
MTAYQEEIEAERVAVGERNRAAGDAFLASNRTAEGVVQLESGLQYRVLSSGSGESPTATDTVVVHYRGTLIDGTEFDSSHRRGEPATFGVDQVIDGWTEALVLMKPGDKWMVYLPPSLAYGERGAGRRIGPNEVLVFELELLEVKRP